MWLSQRHTASWDFSRTEACCFLDSATWFWMKCKCCSLKPMSKWVWAHWVPLLSITIACVFLKCVSSSGPEAIRIYSWQINWFVSIIYKSVLTWNFLPNGKSPFEEQKFPRKFVTYFITISLIIEGTFLKENLKILKNRGALESRSTVPYLVEVVFLLNGFCW